MVKNDTDINYLSKRKKLADNLYTLLASSSSTDISGNAGGGSSRTANITCHNIEWVQHQIKTQGLLFKIFLS